MDAVRIVKISLRVSLSSREAELLKRVLDAYCEDHPERWQPYAGVLDSFRQHISHGVECAETMEMIPLEIYFSEAQALLHLFKRKPRFVKPDQKEGGKLFNELYAAIRKHLGHLTSKEGAVYRT